MLIAADVGETLPRAPTPTCRFATNPLKSGQEITEVGDTPFGGLDDVLVLDNPGVLSPWAVGNRPREGITGSDSTDAALPEASSVRVAGA